MPQDVNCPKCKHVFPVVQARHPVGVDCPACGKGLTVEFRKRPSPIDPGTPPYQLLVEVGKPLANRDESSSTAAKKRSQDDGDKKSTGNQGSMLLVLFASLGAFLIAIAGLGATGYFLFTNLDTTDSSITKLSNPGANTGGNKPGGALPSGVPGVIPGTSPSINPGLNPFPRKGPFELKPVSGPAPTISPIGIDLSRPQMISLPSRVGAVAVGGGGRYIVFHVPDEAQLGVFDANTGQLTRVPSDLGDVKVAAGLSRVVVLAANGTMLRVYSIQETNGPDNRLDIIKQYETNVLTRHLRQIAMGSKTNGPLACVNAMGGIALMSIQADSLQEIEEARKDDLGLATSFLRATPDGRCFLSFDNFENSRLKIAYEENKQWQKRDLVLTPFPGARPDGDLYGNGLICDRKGVERSTGGVGAGSGQWLLPSTTGAGGAFLKVVMSQSGAGGKTKRSINVSVHTNRDTETLANGTTPWLGLPEFEGLLELRGNTTVVARNKPLDQHLFLIPEAKLLVILSADRTKLFLRKCELN
jgi:hypothetical protein